MNILTNREKSKEKATIKQPVVFLTTRRQILTGAFIHFTLLELFVTFTHVLQIEFFSY